jgi:nucleoside-diphosphate-sugar epimerase
MDGVPVLGTVEQMLSIAERQNATGSHRAMPSAPSEFVRALVRRAEDIGLRARAVGDVGRLLTNGDNHRPGTINLRELSTETVVDWPPEIDRRRAARDACWDRRAGFIGSHLTRMLLDRSYNVRVLDNFTYGYAGLSAIRNHPRLEIVTGDICNLRDVSRAMRDVDGVIGLAAIVGDPACNLDPEETINLNYAATKILAECADFYRVQRLVFASSCSVYGASLKEDDLLNERSRLNPVSLYARTRVLSENIIFDRCGDTEPVVLRLATVFGLSPRMRFDLVVNTLTARAVVDRTIAIFGGRQWRPNVHCRDAARAFLTALEAPGDKVAGEVFNVGGDENNHRISEIGDIVASVVGEVAVSLQNEIPDPRDIAWASKIRASSTSCPNTRFGRRARSRVGDASTSISAHMDPMFHNVQALRSDGARDTGGRSRDSPSYRYLRSMRDPSMRMGWETTAENTMRDLKASAIASGCARRGRREQMQCTRALWTRKSCSSVPSGTHHLRPNAGAARQQDRRRAFRRTVAAVPRQNNQQAERATKSS